MLTSDRQIQVFNLDQNPIAVLKIVLTTWDLTNKILTLVLDFRKMPFILLLFFSTK